MSNTPSHPVFALLAALLLATAVPISGQVLGSQHPDGSGGQPDGSNGTGQEDGQASGQNETGQDDGNRTSGDDHNRTAGEPNGSETEERNRSRPNSTASGGNRTGDEDAGEAGQDQRDQRPREDRRDSQDDRGRAPPVTVEDRPNGFATRAPEGSPRPTVEVDVDRGRATVARPDVVPLDVQLDIVVEYRDTDGDGAYDVGEPVLNRTDLRTAPHRVVQDDANETRELVYELHGDGELVLRFDLGTAHGRQVATKVDVRITGHTFEGPDTRLALGSLVEVPGGVETVEIDGEPAIAGTSGDEVAYLSWAPTVEVDGVEHAVGWSAHVSAETPSESAIVYWSYPQGDEIVHDPRLGVTAAVEDLAGQISPFAIGLAVALAVLGVGYATRRRGRL